MSFEIVGYGRAVPALAVDNDAMAKLVDTSDEWIVQRTGISFRRAVSTETAEGLAIEAAQMALDESGLDPAQLDLIIVSTVSGEYLTPSLSCLVQRGIGAACPAVDINAACVGFVYALDMAGAYFDSGRAETVLVVSCEIMTRHVDWSDRSTCVLFGDGAGAVVLRRGEGLLSVHLTAHGDDKLLTIPAAKASSPFDKLEHTSAPMLQMLGAEVYKFAVNAMVSDTHAVLEKAGVKIQEVARFVPHQANARMIQSAAKSLGFTDEQVAINIDRYGNTSSASIPILLSELHDAGHINPGDLIVLSAFGGGLCSGAALIKI